MRAELEVAEVDGDVPAADRLLEDLKQALDLLGDVESAVFALTRVLVLDDDDRLGELTARSLRRLGYDAESSRVMRPLRPREVVVLDLGLAAALEEPDRAALRLARPIVVTGATDPGSRGLAAELAATEYLVKPVEADELAAAIQRRVGPSCQL